MNCTVTYVLATVCASFPHAGAVAEDSSGRALSALAVILLGTAAVGTVKRLKPRPMPLVSKTSRLGRKPS